MSETNELTAPAIPGDRSLRSRHLCSPVDLSQHDVDRADHRNHVSQQTPGAHLVYRLQSGEGWIAHVYAVGFGRAIGDNVVAHLAAGRFDGLVDLACRNGKAFCNDLEVVDERFHLSLHHLTVGQDDFWCVCLDRAFGHAIKRLLTDLYRLAHLLHANDIACPHVAIVRDRHFELKLLIAGVGHIATQIPVDTARAQWRPGDAPRDGVFRREVTDALRPADPDRVAGKQILIFVDL